MSTNVDDSGRIIDPEAEVRKLQKLVQKLTEERSQYLQRDADQIIQRNSKLSEKSNFQDSSDKLNYGLNDVTLDDIELLDVSNFEKLEEEDSWLLESPKTPSPAQRNVSPYKWLREEFDRPSPQVETARRSLITRLDELSRMPRSPSAGSLSLGSPLSPMNGISHLSHVTSTGSISHVTSTGSMPFIRQPLLGLGAKTNSMFDSSTFTRPKKSPLSSTYNKPNNKDTISPSNSPRETPERVDNTDYGNNMDENANGHSGASSGSQESLSHSQRLNDVSAVHMLARLQEESLRQSMNSPHLNCRKTSSTDNLDDPDNDPDEDPVLSSSFNGTSGSLLLNLNHSHNSSGSNGSSPGHYDYEMIAQIKRSNNSLASLSSHSNSPPGSPYGSQYLEHKNQGGERSHRRSLPNLSKGQQIATFSCLPSPHSDNQLQERNTPPRKQPARTDTYRVSPSPNRSLRQPGTYSPQRRGSPDREGSPSRLSPARNFSPHRTYSPQRNFENRYASPGRTLAPQRSMATRNASPGRTLSPQRSMATRNASPGRTLSPQRSMATRNASPGRTLSPQRSVAMRDASPGRTLSPQRSGIPMARSGIPRVSSNTKLPTPRRSSIPSVRRPLTTPQNNDESWKDGCY